MRILFVDDDEATRTVMADLLGDEGLEVEVCATAETALEQLRTRAWDLLITDYVMPGVTGIELVQQCHALPGMAGFRCLVVSGAAPPDVIVGLTWIKKPIDFDELLAVIRSRAQV